MRRHLLPLALLLALFLMPSCVSPARLFKLTPMSDGAPSETVNLWPLYYSNGDAVSFLWPIFDSDHLGFALRPLVFKDRNEWGLLWPISDFDQHYFRLLTLVVAKDGNDNHYGGLIPLFWITQHKKDPFYQFLLAYKFSDCWGIFPILHHGDDTSYCIPLYYWDRQDNTILTPLSYHSPDFNCITLAWWNQNAWGLFPFCRFGDDYSYLLTWWKSPNSTGLFPIYAKLKERFIVGPVWWNSTAWGVFPFCRIGDDWSYFLTWWKSPNSTGLFPFYINTNSFYAIGPVWWNQDTFGLFPLFHWSENNKHVLLYFSKRDPERETEHTMLLPLFHSVRTPKRHDVGLLFHLLGGYTRHTPKTTSPGDGPVASTTSIDWLLWLGKFMTEPYGKNGRQHHFRMWPLFSFNTGHAAKPSDIINSAPDRLLSSMGLAYTNEVDYTRNNAIFGLLWNYDRRQMLTRLPTSPKATWSNALEASIHFARDAVDAYQAKPSPYLEKRLAERHDNIRYHCKQLELEPPAELTPEALDRLERDLTHKYPPQLFTRLSFGMLLDIIDYNRNAHKTEFDLLWGALFHHKHDHVHDRTETSLLWRAYHKLQTPEYTSTHCFPFISFHENHKEKTTVTSFAWRLFRRETSPQENKLWLFFIPFQ